MIPHIEITEREASQVRFVSAEAFLYLYTKGVVSTMKKRMSLNVNKDTKEYIDAKAEFIKYCKLKNLSDATMFYYEDSLLYFTRFLKKEDFKMDEVTADTIEDYTVFLNTADIKSISVNTRLRGLRAFLYWCMEKEYVPAFKIRLVKQEEVIKSTFSDEELMLLLKKPDIKSCSFTEYRNWATCSGSRRCSDTAALMS